MSQTLTKLAGGTALALVAALAPFSVNTTALQTPGSVAVSDLIKLSTACGQTEIVGGCKKNSQYICETQHSDYRGYRND